MTYKSDLTDKEWEIIEPLFTRTKKDKHLCKHKKRDLVNGVRYIVKTGCQWEFLPKEYPPYKTIDSFYVRAKKSGLWEEMMTLLVGLTRIKERCDPNPTYGLVDSQSVKTIFTSEERGIDGKKTKGRKRHIVTDILGCLLAVCVHAANIHDTKSGAYPVALAKEKYPSLKGVCGDQGYCGTFKEIVESFGLTCDIVEKIAPKGWETLPKRWRVERTFAWFNGYRRLSKDYEISTDSTENMVRIAHSSVLLKRLTY